MGSLVYNESTTANYEDHPHSSSSSLAIRLLLAAQSFNQIYTPLLCLFGAVGNTLSVTVFCRTSTHRSLSASFYLSALAISDIGYLINLLAVWLDDMGLRVITLPVTCPLAVCYPLTRPTVCTVARAKKVIFILTSISLIGFSYVWVIARVLTYPMEQPSSPGVTSTISYDDITFNDSQGIHPDSPPYILMPKQFENKSSIIVSELEPTVDSTLLGLNSTIPPILEYITVCSVRAEHVYFSSIASHIDSVLTLVLPFGIISFLNVKIALCVWKLKDQRENLVAMAKVTRQNSRNGSRTHVGFVYRASKHHIHHRHQDTNINHLNGTNNWRSKQNLTVDFEPSESGTSTTSTSVHCCSDFSQRKSNNNQRRARKRRINGTSHAAAETRVTKTLLLVSTVFLVLNLPSHAIRATNFIQSFWELKIGQEALFAAQLWSNILFNMNFSVNFLLYCLSGRNFRQSLKNIFCSASHHLPRYPKSRRSCSPNTYGKPSLTRSPSMTRTRENSFYPVSVTEMETYA